MGSNFFQFNKRFLDVRSFGVQYCKNLKLQSNTDLCIYIHKYLFTRLVIEIGAEMPHYYFNPVYKKSIVLLCRKFISSSEEKIQMIQVNIFNTMFYKKITPDISFISMSYRCPHNSGAMEQNRPGSELWKVISRNKWCIQNQHALQVLFMKHQFLL